MTRYDTPRTDAGLEVNTAVVTPTDRIRWGPILAGVFAAITTAAVLSTLGAAIGMSAYDRTDDPRTFAIGAGVWGGITMLIAFALGGWLAARSAAPRGRSNGLLNGIMVAAAGIPLLMYLLGSAGTAMSSAALSNARDTQTGQQMAGAGSGGALDSAMQAGAQMAGSGVDAVSGGGDQSANQSGNQAMQAEQAADTGRRAAWGTLIALLLALGAAAAGGYLGARDTDRDFDRDHGRAATA